MRTNIVLIDFESVQPDSLAGLSQDHFKVFVFVGANQTKIPVEIVTAMQGMGERAEYVRIAGTGKNALDFHIAFYIGQLAERDPGAFFHIISKDTGFDPLIQHLKSRKIFSARSPSIADIPLVKTSNAKIKTEKAQQYMDKLRQPKVTRPRSIKTLTSSIGSFFQKQLTETEVAAVLAEMQRSGFISLDGSKVVYLQ